MPKFTSSNLLQYLGLVGSSGLSTGSLVPRANTPDAEQRLRNEFVENGKLGDPELWSRFNSYMRRPTTLDSMFQMWEEMAGWDLLAAALVEVVDEATQLDSNSPATLWYQCNDKEFEDDLNDMALRLGTEELLPSQVYYVAALGNHFEKIEYAPKEGVMGLSFVHPMEMRRYWLERNRKCVGFRWTGHKPNKEDIFVGADNQTPVERVSLSDGKSTEDLWYPWDFMHMRRMYRQRATEHGEPIFAEADGIYKKIRLAVDQMVVHRAQIQPDRYAINIDTQDQPPSEQMKTVNRWRQQMRSKLAFGQTNEGNGVGAPQDFTSYYNALALDTVLYIANPKGFSNTITKLQGTAQVPDVYDIELLTDLFYSIIGMPRSWFGAKSGGDGGGETPSGKALLAQDMRFLRKIKSIRRPIIQSYEWLGYFHAILKKKDPKMLEIKAMMPPIGSLEDSMKMELLEQQANVLNILGDVMDKYHLPKEAWIETIFKRYMHLPDDVVNVFMTALPSEIETQQQEGKKDAPRSYQLIREIQEKLNSVPGGKELVHNLRHAAFLNDSLSESIKEKRHRVLVEGICKPVITRENDLVVSSYGKSPFELKANGKSKTLHESKTYVSMQVNSEHKSEPTEEPAYRKWI